MILAQSTDPAMAADVAQLRSDVQGMRDDFTQFRADIGTDPALQAQGLSLGLSAGLGLLVLVVPFLIIRRAFRSTEGGE